MIIYDEIPHRLLQIGGSILYIIYCATRLCIGTREHACARYCYALYSYSIVIAFRDLQGNENFLINPQAYSVYGADISCQRCLEVWINLCRQVYV